MSSYSPNQNVHGNPFLEIPSDMDTNPFRHVLEDTGSIFKYSKMLIFIVTPHRPWPSGALDELYPNFPNTRDLILHTLLLIVQIVLIVTFLIFLATFLVFPVVVPVVFFGLFWLVTVVILRLLNGPPTSQSLVGVPSDGTPVNDESELWFFVNGIGTGQTWLQSNLDLLANIFRREIVGIHNPTKGLLLDLVECLIQRDLDYKTRDIRQGRAQIRAALKSQNTKKVVLIAHSQGGIVACSIIDWLFGELSHKTMRKLEVYTFGNAARHFRNPPLDASNANSKQQEEQGDTEPVIKYIEHYANSEDFVANIGVLEFTSPMAKYTSTSLFSGAVFRREGSGHLLNLHYLDAMFDKQDDFMNTKIPVSRQDAPDGIIMKPIGELSRLFRYKNGQHPEE